jgi:DnaJ-class molecular chaperone
MPSTYDDDDLDTCQDCGGTGTEYNYKDDGWQEVGDCKTCGGSGLAENHQ